MFRVDLEINNWAYAATSNKLAIITEVKAPKFKGDKEEGKDEEGLKIDFNDYEEKEGEKKKPIGFFTWVKDAKNDDR